MRELSLGMAGPDVRRWQRFLIRERHSPVPHDGTFGIETEAATSAFQVAQSLPKTGRADAATLAAALTSGLLDQSLDEPSSAVPPSPAAAPSRPAASVNWGIVLPAFGAVAAALWTFWSSVELERRRFEASLIQQALQVGTAEAQGSWTDARTRVEIATRLQAYVDLKLVTLITEEVMATYWRRLSTVPLPASVPAVAAAVPGTAPTPQAAQTPSRPPAAAPRFTQLVFVQFAGSLDRADIQRMMRDLSNDWRVQGAERGGQRTAAALDTNQIRYNPAIAADAEAAAALATQVNAARVVPAEVKATANPLIRAGTLEVWLSR